METLNKFLRKLYNKLIHSIAFVPAFAGIGFLLLSMLCMHLDKAGIGEQLNDRFTWLTLKDAATARTIVATVATGLISLMVFSFSMVMIVMTQAASQMSNRTIENIISDRFQKFVLGFYIGTIVFALFLLTNISETDKAMKVPSLSVYTLLAFTVFDIFLFVYFLHFITQSFRYEQMIKRIHNRTNAALHKWTASGEKEKTRDISKESHELLSRESGYFQGFSLKRLMKLAVEKDVVIRFLHTEGTYILKNTPFIEIHGHKPDYKWIDKLFLDIDFYYGQEIDKNPYYGFRHLMEVGVKALSPGINDPGTAAISINALTDLLSYKLNNRIKEVLTDDGGNPRIVTKEIDFHDLFDSSLMPIWDYGKKDRLVQNTMKRALSQLMFIDKEQKYKELFNALMKEVDNQQS